MIVVDHEDAHSRNHLKPSGAVLRSLPSEIQKHFELALECSSQFREEELEETVHAVRKSCKRIRAYLHLTEKPKSETCDGIRVMVRNASLLLSPIRDAHVAPRSAAKVLNSIDLLGTPGFDAKSLCRMVESLANEQVGSVASQKGRLQACHDALQLAFSDFQMGSVDATKSSLRRGLKRSYHRARFTTLQVLVPFDSEHVHELRKATKRFGYQCELAAELLERDLLSEVQRSQSLSDRIGDALDLQVLLRSLEHVPHEPSQLSSWNQLKATIEAQRDKEFAAVVPIACQAYFRTARQYQESALGQKSD